ncbi:hypothetical protein KPBAA1705_26704, partial [Klebsiella pneumoniae ATCC BAA-1705]
NFVSTFDNPSHNITFMRYTNLTKRRTAHKAICAYKTEHTRDHLITGRSIMRVKKNDFGYFCSFIGPFTAKSYHMLSMPPFILIPYS